MYPGMSLDPFDKHFMWTLLIIIRTKFMTIIIQIFQMRLPRHK